MEEYQIVNKAGLENEHVCANCFKQINVPPIHSIERNGLIEDICGRCLSIVDGIGKTKKWRQYLFEDFGKFLTFPCSNKKFGCKIVLQWDDVLSHEKICTFIGTKCPLAQRNIFPEETCTWEGNIKELHQHIEETHKNLIINPPQIEWTDWKENKIFFTNVGTQIITILMKYEKASTYYCLLMVNGNDISSQCYRYQLEMFDEIKNNSIILRKSRLEPLQYMLENLNNAEKMLEIDMTKIKHMLHAKNMSGRFGVVRKSKKEIAVITNGKEVEILSIPVSKPKENKIVDEKMLQELECPVCNEYMIPPIFICKTGHSVCSVCKKKIMMCPNCRDGFTGARNFTLEKLTTKVNYPCRNKDLGCLFVTTSDKIVTHQLNCELSEKPCLLTCLWQGLQSELYNHFKISHPDSLRPVDTVHIYDIGETHEIFYLLQCHGELFRFSIKEEITSNAQKFNIQQLGSVASEPKFRYQLQIIDHSPLGLNLSFTNVCRPATDLKTAHFMAIAIPWNLLQPFIFETRYFYYKILITKI